MTAVLWQRSIASLYAKLNAIVTSAQLESSLPADPGSYLSWLSGAWSTSNATYVAAVDQARRDLDFVRSFDAYFTSLGQATVPALASETAASEPNGATIVARLISRIYVALLDTMGGPEATTWSDPYLDLQKIGNAVGSFSTAAAGAGTFSYLASFSPPTALVANELTGPLWVVAITLFVIAFVVGGMLPLLPVLYFIAAALGWLLVVTEAMIAMPVWLISKFLPARTPSLVGESRRGYVFMLGLLLRPALIVVGLIASIVMTRVGIDLVNMMFRGILPVMAPDGTVGTILAGLAGLVAYTLALFSLVTFTSSLITTLPQTVLGWIDASLTASNAAVLGSAMTARGYRAPAGRRAWAERCSARAWHRARLRRSGAPSTGWHHRLRPRATDTTEGAAAAMIALT